MTWAVALRLIPAISVLVLYPLPNHNESLPSLCLAPTSELQSDLTIMNANSAEYDFESRCSHPEFPL
jgi:hypothetical protein